MKTNTFKIILSAIAVSALSLIAIGNASLSNLLPTMAVTISYVAVILLLAVAAVDYRTGSKSYNVR